MWNAFNDAEVSSSSTERSGSSKRTPASLFEIRWHDERVPMPLSGDRFIIYNLQNDVTTIRFLLKHHCQKYDEIILE